MVPVSTVKLIKKNQNKWRQIFDREKPLKKLMDATKLLTIQTWKIPNQFENWKLLKKQANFWEQFGEAEINQILGLLN